MSCHWNTPRIGPVHELATNPELIPISGIGGHTSALGYIMINVQIGGIPSYNEEQVTLVIEDVSGQGMRVPIILGMPTIHRLCSQMKESEMTLPQMSGNMPYVVTKQHKTSSYSL